MASRSSARLQNRKASLPPVQQSALTETRDRKRKASEIRASDTKERRGKDVKVSAAGKSPLLPDIADDYLSSMPSEIFELILDAIQNDKKGRSTMSKLGRTSKRFQRLTAPRLYKRIELAAQYHANIQQLIRTAEPYLTIAQRKHLKQQGRYKGQQDDFSSRLDADAVPVCSDYLRQLVVGYIDPGPKHKPICICYVEEVLKNLKNLETFDSVILTRSMAQSIASIQSLKALQLGVADLPNDATESLMSIGNLKHLSIQHRSLIGYPNIARSIILRSASTLQSLKMKGSSSWYDFLIDWEDFIQEDQSIASLKHSLVALKALSLSGLSFDEAFIKSLSKAIDFAALQELDVGVMAMCQDLFWEHLIETYTSTNENAYVKLKTLRLEIPSPNLDRTPANIQVWFGMQCRLLSLFNTLTTLEIKNFTYSEDEGEEDSILQPPRSLLQGILQQKSLTNLAMSYKAYNAERRVSWLSPSTVRTIIDGLPELQHFEFALDQDFEDIARELARGANLRSIKCLLFYTMPRSAVLGGDAVSACRDILNTYLSAASVQEGTEFVWEKHYKLEHMTIDSKSWAVASKFGKQKQKSGEKRLSTTKDGTMRQVLYRDILRPASRASFSANPDSSWVDWIENEL